MPTEAAAEESAEKKLVWCWLIDFNEDQWRVTTDLTQRELDVDTLENVRFGQDRPMSVLDISHLNQRLILFQDKQTGQGYIEGFYTGVKSPAELRHEVEYLWEQANDGEQSTAKDEGSQD